MSYRIFSLQRAVRLGAVIGVFLSLMTTAALAAPFELSVTNGAGSGIYQQSDTVHIWANPYDDSSANKGTREMSDLASANRTFDRWVGDVAAVENIYSQDTRIVMPASNVSLTATYKDTSRWAPMTVISEFPAAHRAVIFMFHGKGGCAACLFQLAESRRFIDDALSRGYAVVAVDSLERGDEARWSNTDWSEVPDPANNVDIQRIVRVRNQLIADGEMSGSEPVYMVGMSNGGIFASLFTVETQAAVGFPVDAMVMMVSPGSLATMPTTSVPTVFILAENDTMPEGTGSVNTTALIHYDDLLARGIPTQLHVAKEIPLHPDRFWRIERLDQNDSHTLFNAFGSNGVIDSNGYLVSNPRNEGWKLSLPPGYEDWIVDIGNQLKVVYAEHKFVNTLGQEVFAFLDNPNTSIDQVPAVFSFVPASAEPGIVVTLQGENFVDIQSVEFNGEAAEIISIMPDTLWVRVPDFATTGAISVTNSAGTGYSNQSFTVINVTPVIDSVSPVRATEGSVVTIYGSDFADLTQVTFSGISAEILGASPTKIWVRVPAGAVTGEIEVANQWGSAVWSTNFEVLSLPGIDSLSSNYGSVGTEVILTGSHFVYVQQVEYGSVPAEFEVISEDEIRVIIPQISAAYAVIKVRTDAGLAVSSSVFVIL